MPLISGDVPNLINGISQQPYAIRLASQAENQSNFHSTPSTGLRRRPATRHIASLSGVWGSSLIHTIDRDEQEQYVVKIGGGSLEVFDLEGVAQTVNFPDGASYLNATKDDFRAITVADFTFIVNTSVTCAMSGGLTATRPAEALVSIRTGNYGRTYKVFINGTLEGTYTTPDGGVATDANKIDTDFIVAQIKQDLEANLDPLIYKVRRVASTLRIETLDGSDFTIYAEDGTGGNGSVVVKDRVQRFTNLPRAAFRNFTVEIAGDNNSAFDNYWVEYQSPDALKDTDGVWAEAVKPGIPFEIDAATMPHVLVREANGTFTFKQAEWGQREVGDEESAPEPSFIGRNIANVFFHRNRLGFLCDENVILSEAGGFFNFWPRTVTTILDSDVIDVATSHTRVSLLKHALPYNEKLLLFSDDTQFNLEGGALLTAQTVRIQQTTEYESNSKIAPLVLGTNVYFPYSQGDSSGLWEYRVGPQGESNEAVDAASHVPTLVPKEIEKMVGTSTLDLIAIVSSSQKNRMFIYKFFFSGRDKLQAAWYPWDFPAGDEILSASIIETTMYLIIRRGNDTFLESINLEDGSTDEGSEIEYCVDRKVYETDLQNIVYDPGDNTTSFTLPYNEDGELWCFVRAGDAVEAEGRSFITTRPGSDTFKITGDHRTTKLCVGRKVLSRYTFSPFLIRRSLDGGGQIAVGSERVQILYLTLRHAPSGYFKVLVTPEDRDTFEYCFTGRDVGTSGGVIGDIPNGEGKFRNSVFAENLSVDITIETDHYLPASFMSAEWEGRSRSRSRRV